MKHLVGVVLALCLASSVALAQQPSMQFFRPTDKTGLHTFETTKADSVLFKGLSVRIGGGFAQDYQALSDQNYVPLNTKLTGPQAKADSANILDPLTSGFNLAMADMSIDAQLDDGVRMNLVVYLSSKHHNESWVKGGYLQLDKMTFMHSSFIDDAMKYLTLKVGDLEVDYGDAHFRRVDGGNSVFNPFVENYIMDEFATEIGAEVYFHHESGFLAMFGVTDGMLNPTVVAANAIDSVTKSPNAYQPAYHAKLGFDKQINNDLRIRLTGSIYTEGSTASSTLFGGDRTGSHYFLVMEPVGATTTGNAFSGRFNPGFSDQVTTIMINPFVKYDGLEFFATYESANGRSIKETTTRKASQMAADLIYRFGASENFWVGGRYNQVKATPAGYVADITINRIAASAGWFMTNNVMLKLEYVSQTFDGFSDGTLLGTSGKAIAPSILSAGKFNGLMVEAVLGF